VENELVQSISLLIRRAKAMVLKRGRHGTKIPREPHIPYYLPVFTPPESDQSVHVRMAQRE